MNIYRFIMKDGSRHFADLPENTSWEEFRDHIARLPGAKVTGFLTDHITEVWIDFTYKGYAFTVNNQFGEYWFFVKKPRCPDETLTEVIGHCEQMAFPEAA